MAEADSNLVSDLADLHDAGTIYLPAIAAQFVAARQALSVNEAQDGYFWRPEDFMGGGYGPVREALVNMRDTLATVFRDSESNMLETGRALVVAADLYAETDRDNAQALRDELERRQISLSRPPEGQG